MEDDASGRQPDRSASASSDRPIDFSKYSTAQLHEIRGTIDQRAHPQTYQGLLAELSRREASGADEPQSAPSETVRFTSGDGLRGWVEAKARRLRLYGLGSIQVAGGEVVFRGWERTWLGVAVESELRVHCSDIRSVIRLGQRLTIQCAREGLRSRKFEVQTESSDRSKTIASAIEALCPPEMTKKWDELSAFSRRLNALTTYTPVTRVLVALNVLVFVAEIATKGWNATLDPQFLLALGANFGPLTVGGQWWRLLISTFLHFGPLHLALNMWVLWNAGSLVERIYGRSVLLTLYLYCGVLGSLASLAWDPNRIGAGASGAIFGILGALLAFLSHRKGRLPASIVRAYLPSTLIFVLFNLISGFLHTNIDNAAHVAGVTSGFILGWLLVRPVTGEAVQEPPVKHLAASIALAAAALCAGLWQVGVLSQDMSGPQRFLASNMWYSDGEAENLRTFQRIQLEAQAGTVSNTELEKRLRRDILPFWKDADTRLRKAVLPTDPEERRFVELLRQFVTDRLAWAETLADGAGTNDSALVGKAAEKLKDADKIAAQIQRLEIRTQLDHRTRALANSPSVRRIRNAFDRSTWKCLGPIAAGLSIDPIAEPINDGRAGRATAGCTAQSAFARGDYDALEAMMSRSSAHLGDLIDGSSSLSGIESGLNDLFTYRADWDQSLAKLADWRKQRPDSINADLVEAILFSEGAWAARGRGYADSVTPQQWASFARQLEMAAAGLKDIQERAKGQPLWYHLSLSIAHDQGISTTDLRARFNEAVSRFPEYLPLYREMIRALMPRWGGSYQEIDQFVQDMYKKVPVGRGFEKYVEIYDLLPRLEGGDFDLFSDTLADWPSMRHGFQDMMREHPKSRWVLNRFAYFSCVAGDATQYRALRLEIGARAWKDAWEGKFSTQYCDRTMAAKGGS